MLKLRQQGWALQAVLSLAPGLAAGACRLLLRLRQAVVMGRESALIVPLTEH